MFASTGSFVTSTIDNLQSKFLSIVAKIETHARIYFRHILCPSKKADRIAEVVALAWKWFKRLAEKGKDATKFPCALASLAARAVKSGRRVCGQERAKDVMSSTAQQRHGFIVEALPISTCRSHENLYGDVNGQRQLDLYEERLHDNAMTPPPDQAAFRIDFPRFLGDLTHRDRELAHYLSLGHSNKHAASKFGLSPSRVTQLRQQMGREWRIGQGEVEKEQSGAENRKMARMER